jgi:hypothetical protein
MGTTDHSTDTAAEKPVRRPHECGQGTLDGENLGVQVCAKSGHLGVVGSRDPVEALAHCAGRPARREDAGAEHVEEGAQARRRERRLGRGGRASEIDGAPGRGSRTSSSGPSSGSRGTTRAACSPRSATCRRPSSSRPIMTVGRLQPSCGPHVTSSPGNPERFTIFSGD